MGSIFINYRRGETAGEAMALFNQLSAALGKDSVFMDVANIDLGRDFREALNERLASCDLMLAIVGRGWVDGKGASGRRRLDEPNDYVRLEIAAALKRNIPVLPVLVQGVHMPSADELPEDLGDFAFRNAFELSHSRWDSDVREMLKRLGLGEQRPKRHSTAALPSGDAGQAQAAVAKRWLAVAGPVAVVLALGGLLYHRSSVQDAAADAELASAKAEAAKARAAADAASAALATAQIEKQGLIAKAAKQAVLDPAINPSSPKAVRPIAASAPGAPITESQSLFKQARALERGEGVTRDLAEAAKLYRTAAEQGNAAAQFAIGRMHQFGRGVTKDDALALGWNRKAAAQGNADAQYALGISYSTGRGVPIDEAEATRWYRQAAAGFRRAADLGEAEAQYLLGHMVLHGRGLPKDEQEALKWFRRAADQSHMLAQHYVGLAYANGQGVAKDDVEAAKWCRKSADQGHAPAQYLLGVSYANGRGVAKDEAEAVRWYRKAAERGHKDAQAALTRRGLTWTPAS